MMADRFETSLMPTWVANMDPPFPGLDFPTVQRRIDDLYHELFGYVREGFQKLHNNQSLESVYPILKGVDPATASTIFRAALASQNFGEAIPLSRSEARKLLPYAEKYTKAIDQIGNQLATSQDNIRLLNYALVRFLTSGDRQIVNCPADGNDLLKNFIVTISPNQFMTETSVFTDPKREIKALNTTKALFPFHDLSHWVAVSTSFQALRNEAPMALHLFEKYFDNLSGIHEKLDGNPLSHDFIFEEITNSLYFKFANEGYGNAMLASKIANELYAYMVNNHPVQGYHLENEHRVHKKPDLNTLAILSMLSMGELPASQIDPNLSLRCQDPEKEPHKRLNDEFTNKTSSQRIQMLATEYQNKLANHEKRPFIKDWARHLTYMQLAQYLASDPALSAEDRVFARQIQDWLLFNDLHQTGQRINLLKRTMDRLGLLEKMTPEERSEFEKLARRDFDPIQVSA